MEYEKLKEEIKEIGKIASSVPEQFREKCFEILLNHLLSASDSGSPPPPKPPKEDKTPPKTSTITFPSHIKAFMRRRSVTQEQIESIIMLEGDEFHFVKEPEHGQASKGQIDWALLLALKNGIVNNSLKVDPEEVRSMVQEKGFYDQANFSANFRKQKYASLFKGMLEPQGDPQSLSSDGETALADLIKTLSGIS